MRYTFEDKKMVVSDNDVELGYIDYQVVRKKELIIKIVYLNPAARGRGLGAKMMEKLYIYVVESKYQVVPTCPFAEKWFNENPSKQDVLKK